MTWNRHGPGDRAAKLFDGAGARVIVTENGYLPMRGSKKTFALALHHHNGAGIWPIGAERRSALLDVELKPWRTAHGDLLVLPQRGIGPAGVAMPRTWPTDVRRRLALATKRRVRVRPHPGTDKPTRGPTLEEDLEGVGACVVWASSAGLKAVIAGVPVFYEFGRWIGAPAATMGIANLEQPSRPDRLEMLERVAWAQWSVEELETGEPIARLLEVKR